MRGVVGFLTFFAAFVLKKQGEPAWVYGLVIVGSAIGNATGSVIAPLLRRKVREEWILAGSLVAPAIPLFFAARSYGRLSIVFAGFAVAAASALARLAFDSLLQRDGADAARGRAFARFETRFQIVWVIGGLARGALLRWRTRRDLPDRARVALRRALLHRRGAPSGPEKYRARTRGDRLEEGHALRGPRHHRRRDGRSAARRQSRVRAAAGSRRPAACVGARRARPHPVRVRRRRARRREPRVLLRAHDARRRGAPRGRGLVGRRGADAPPAGRAQPDDRRAPRRRARAGRARRDAHRVREQHLRALRIRRRDVATRAHARARARTVRPTGRRRRAGSVS